MQDYQRRGRLRYSALIRVGVKERGPILGGQAEGAPKRGGSTRFPCFDGLRAFAALSVIGVHTTFASGFTGRHPALRPYAARLEIGVAVFFVISGFLLYRPFAAAHFGRRSAPATRTFWVKRLKRIIPAYWLALIVVCYLMHADVKNVHHAWFSPIIYFGFLQIYFPSYAVTGLSQAWSLCTEITFYLFLPLYALVLAKGAESRTTKQQLRVELSGLAALVGFGLAYRIPVLLNHSDVAHTMPNWLPGYFDVFALGMLLAVGRAWMEAEGGGLALASHPLFPWVCWGLAAACFVAVSNLGLPWVPLKVSPLGQSLARQTLYELFGFFMVAPAVFGPQNHGLIRRALQWKPIAAVGAVSYGVYLWHEAWMEMYFRWTGDKLFQIPLPNMVVVVTGLAIVSAALSYRLVEKPILTGRLPSFRLGRGAVSS